ncbi:MAG: VPA1267 family protein [Sedimenticola sp.]
MSYNNGKKSKAAQENLDKFDAWKATLAEQDFRDMFSSRANKSTGGLHRQSVADGCGFAKSVLTQNQLVRKSLEKLENDLRERKIFPDMTEKAKKESEEPIAHDRNALKHIRDSKRIAELEELVLQLKARLRRYKELEQVIGEVGLDKYK